MNRIRAVMRNTIAQAVRNRAAFVVMGIYLLLVPVLPFVVRGDGTLQGLVHVVITYLLILAAALLSILTVALASTTLYDDLRERQIFIIESKPVRRWQLLVGKLLGILVIDAVLLAFVAVALLACVRIIIAQDRWNAVERELTRRQVLAARRALSPRPAVSDDEVRRQYETLKQDGRLPEGITEQETLERIRKQLAMFANIVPPRGQRTWTFDGVRAFRGAPALDRGTATGGGPAALVAEGKNWRPDLWRHMTITITGGTGRGQVRSIAGNTADTLSVNNAWDEPPDASSRYVIQSAPTLRVKFHRSDAASADPVPCVWGFGVPGTKDFYRTPPAEFKPGEFIEIPIPLSAVGENGELQVRLFNASQDDIALVFSGSEAVRMLVPVSGFTGNLLRSLALLLAQLIFLAVLGLFFSTYVSFPLAPIAAFSILLVIYMTGMVRTDIEKGYAFQRHGGGRTSVAYEYFVRGLVAVLDYSLPDFDTHTASVSTGLEVPWGAVVRSVGGTVLLRGGLLMLLGAWIFHGRELALHAR